MTRTITFFLLMCISMFCRAQLLKSADFAEDVAYLKQTLPEKHTNLFAKISKAEFDRKVDSIAVQSASLHYDAFLVKLFELVVAIKDEHTFIEFDYKKSFPIQFSSFKEGIFATAINAETKVLLPAKLVAIDHHPISHVVSSFKTIIQNENPSFFMVGMLRYLNHPLLLHGLNLTKSNEMATYTLETLDGQRFDLTLNASAETQQTKLSKSEVHVSLIPEQKTDNYWFTYDAPHQIVYFNYLKCSESAQLPFKQFNDSLFAAIAKHQPKKIVLDLRYNGGGNSAILNPFIEKISTSEFNKKGKFYVLIGERTFSSALMNAVRLKRYTKAMLVGHTTSGTINHYGEVRGFDLPKTKIGIAYSTRYWETWKGKKGPLVPDFKVDYSVVNFVNGNDEALDVVYRK